MAESAVESEVRGVVPEEEGGTGVFIETLSSLTENPLEKSTGASESLEIKKHLYPSCD